MGTRHLICVFLDNEYKVAQYGQWDGYPEGQGMECLHFLRDEMFESHFLHWLRKMTFASNEYIQGVQDGIYSVTNNYNKTMDLLSNNFPQFVRDLSVGILSKIQNGEITPFLHNSLKFAADSLFCEWAYVIDLDKRTFEVYKGFNQTPLTENDRFFWLEEESYKEYRDDDRQYHPVKIVHSWELDKLPTDEEFLAEFNKEENE